MHEWDRKQFFLIKYVILNHLAREMSGNINDYDFCRKIP